MANSRSSSSPLVSVLLTIYKVEDYLSECLDSLLHQTYKNLEIVCVNNGSPDKCDEILQNYQKKDNRIKIVSLKENKNLCGGRNAGLDVATGEFICFVDPDDYIEKDNIKAMVDTICSVRTPSGKLCQMVLNYSAVNFENITNKLLFDYEKTLNKTGWLSIEDYNINPEIDANIPMWNRLFRKDFIDQHKLRFEEGSSVDNIPFNQKALAYMKEFYVITSASFTERLEIKYHRRMLTADGAITADILFKNFDLVQALESLYLFLQKTHNTNKIRVPFSLFFSLCFTRHKDMPGYYQVYKKLLSLMEHDIKNSEVYPKEDLDLCNLIINTSDYFQFCSLFFAPSRMSHILRFETKYKLFDVLTIFEIENHRPGRTVFKILNIPFLKIRILNGSKRAYLFGFIPLLAISTKSI